MSRTQKFNNSVEVKGGLATSANISGAAIFTNGEEVSTKNELTSQIQSLSSYVDSTFVTEPQLNTAISSISGISGSVSAQLTDDITASQDVGAIEAGQVLTQGTTFQEFVEELLTSTFYPTFQSPSVNLTEDISNTIEVGTVTNITLVANFDRGAINGDLVGNVWNANTKQNDRAGAATLYTIDGNNNGTNNTLVLSNYVIQEGSNSWSVDVDYAQGPQPLDSDGNNYDSPLVAGSVSDSVSVNGRRRLFFGTEQNATVPTSSSEIRDLFNNNPSNNVLNPNNGTTFTINVPVGAEKVVFAYPANLSDVDEVIYVEGLGSDIKGSFNQTLINVEGVSGFSAISYKVYTFVPVSAFSQTATYNVTI